MLLDEAVCSRAVASNGGMMVNGVDVERIVVAVSVFYLGTEEKYKKTCVRDLPNTERSS